MNKLILDMDVGIDDAMALAFVLASPEAELLGITGTFGNVAMTTSVRNSLRLLECFDRTDIPVYPGSTHALQKEGCYYPDQTTQDIHGADGVGNIGLSEPVIKAQTEDAIDYLIRMIRTYQKELVIVPTGPLANIARVFQKAPETAAMVGRIVLMGGTFMLPGNITPFAEANIGNDPEAAKIVFESGAPLTLVGLDVTHRTLLRKEDVAKWRQLGTENGRNFADMVDFYLKIYEKNAPQLKGCPIHDPLATMVALYPDLVTTLESKTTVMTEGVQRGRTIMDPAKLNQKDGKTKIALNVDEKRADQLFKSRLTRILKTGE